jgi:hypothetical protein
VRVFIVDHCLGDWEPSQLLCVAESLEQAIATCDRYPKTAYGYYKFAIREASEAGVHAEYSYDKEYGLSTDSEQDILVEDELNKIAEEPETP